MKKILVPVDFSGNTDILCTYALELARKDGAGICLFHTFFDKFIVADSSFPDSIDMSTMYNEELLKEIFNQAEKKLDQLFDDFQERIRKETTGNITLTKKLTGGEIGHEVMEVCEEFQPDLVIIGQGMQENNITFWGEVTSHIIDKVKVPVVVVPEGKKYQGFAQMMFSADLVTGNSEAISKIAGILEPFGSHIHCVHFLTKKGTKEKNEMTEKMKALESTLIAGGLPVKIDFSVLPVKDNIQDSINEYIRDNNINIVGFQPHKLNLFYGIFTKTVTKKNLIATNVPLLAVPVV
jgi:nucleotide-binding universal stress UspA family protein